MVTNLKLLEQDVSLYFQTIMIGRGLLQLDSNVLIGLTVSLFFLCKFFIDFSSLVNDCIEVLFHLL